MDVSRVSRTCLPTPRQPCHPCRSLVMGALPSRVPHCPPTPHQLTSCLSEHLSGLSGVSTFLPPSLLLRFHLCCDLRCAVRGARCVVRAPRRHASQCQARLGHGLRHLVNNVHPSTHPSTHPPIHPVVASRPRPTLARVRPVTLNDTDYYVHSQQ